MCNVIDDKLLDIINVELAHYGIFVPISKIEATIIKAYELITNSHPELNLDANNKSDKYYILLKDSTCCGLISEARLTTARNPYEAISILTILQNYLDEFTNTAQINRIKAPEAFEEMLNELPFKTHFSISNSGWSTILPRTSAPSGCTILAKRSRLCTNCDEPHNMNCCSETEEVAADVLTCGECYNLLTFAINYKELCIGFKVDPDILGLNNDIYKHELPDYTKVIENIIDKAATEFKNKALEIFLMICEEYKNEN